LTSGTGVEVLLYSAPGCGLCDEARHALERERTRLGFDLREVDISGDDELERRWRIDVPVVLVDGQVACRHVVLPSRLERLILAAQAGSAGGLS
jgi:glutaredoxin